MTQIGMRSEQKATTEPSRYGVCACVFACGVGSVWRMVAHCLCIHFHYNNRVDYAKRVLTAKAQFNLVLEKNFITTHCSSTEWRVTGHIFFYVIFDGLAVFVA